MSGQNEFNALAAGLQRMGGGFASRWGPTYDVFRLGASTPAGGILSGTAAIAGYRAWIERTTRRDLVEAAVFDLEVFVATCDSGVIALGDVLRETGPGSDGGIYTFAQNRSARESLFVRTEFGITISRPVPDGGRADQQPGDGAVVAPGYFGETIDDEQILTVASGSYSFAGPGATACTVYAGLQPLKGVHDANGPVEDPIPRAHFVAYVGPMTGAELRVRDVMTFPNRDRFLVASVHANGNPGFVGYVAVVERLASRGA
jgi:hypothetical protein